MSEANYVLRRAKKKTGTDTHKTTHWGTERKTMCGREVDEMWFIDNSAVAITCRKCIFEMRIAK